MTCYLISIAYFGSPEKFLSENGEEFSNETYREKNEKLNVVTLTTAEESPLSNGTVEHHNLVVPESMKKIIQDVKCLPEVANLAWAIGTKNSLQNYGGFSPNQLVFGHNINPPPVLTDALPTLENCTSSDIIRKKM